MVTSAMVKAEVNFLQDTSLKKLKLRWEQFPRSRCSMETFVWQFMWGTLEIRQARQDWDSLWIDLVIPVYIPSFEICRMR